MAKSEIGRSNVHDLSKSQEKALFASQVPNEDRTNYAYPDLVRHLYPEKFGVIGSRRCIEAKNSAYFNVRGEFVKEMQLAEHKLRVALGNVDRATPYTVSVLQRLGHHEIAGGLTLDELMESIYDRSNFSKFYRLSQDFSRDFVGVRFREVAFESTEGKSQKNGKVVNKAGRFRLPTFEPKELAFISRGLAYMSDYQADRLGIEFLPEDRENFTALVDKYQSTSSEDPNPVDVDKVVEKILRYRTKTYRDKPGEEMDVLFLILGMDFGEENSNLSNLINQFRIFE